MNLPIWLLIMFFAGYLIVGFFGMNGHIAKPLDIPSMKATLQQVLSSRIAPHREREA